jgi:hypothetical protein
MFLFLFIAVDLVLFGVIPLNSVIVTLLPLIGLIVGVLLGIMARKRQPAGESQPSTPVAA